MKRIGLASGNNTKTSRIAAYRELADLVEMGYLTPTGKAGRRSGYEIVW